MSDQHPFTDIPPRFPRLSKAGFILLSCTWGLPLTLLGGLICLCLLLTGRRPQRWGYGLYFSLGRGGRPWGGCSFGPFILIDSFVHPRLLDHEFGHCLQNCVFGPFTPFIVTAPSSLRFWYRKLPRRRRSRGPYDSVWFEHQATVWGRAFMRHNFTGSH